MTIERMPDTRVIYESQSISYMPAMKKVENKNNTTYVITKEIKYIGVNLTKTYTPRIRQRYCKVIMKLKNSCHLVR
jgi:hypothetical protein